MPIAPQGGLRKPTPHAPKVYRDNSGGAPSSSEVAKPILKKGVSKSNDANKPK